MAKITRVRSGCWTCKERRRKCDETKPECLNCVKTGRKCGGYGIRLSFDVDDSRNSKFKNSYNSKGEKKHGFRGRPRLKESLAARNQLIDSDEKLNNSSNNNKNLLQSTVPSVPIVAAAAAPETITPEIKKENVTVPQITQESISDPISEESTSTPSQPLPKRQKLPQHQQQKERISILPISNINPKPKQVIKRNLTEDTNKSGTPISNTTTTTTNSTSTSNENTDILNPFEFESALYDGLDYLLSQGLPQLNSPFLINGLINSNNESESTELIQRQNSTTNNNTTNNNNTGNSNIVNNLPDNLVNQQNYQSLSNPDFISTMSNLNNLNNSSLIDSNQRQNNNNYKYNNQQQQQHQQNQSQNLIPPQQQQQQQQFVSQEDQIPQISNDALPEHYSSEVFNFMDNTELYPINNAPTPGAGAGAGASVSNNLNNNNYITTPFPNSNDMNNNNNNSNQVFGNFTGNVNQTQNENYSNDQHQQTNPEMDTSNNINNNNNMNNPPTLKLPFNEENMMLKHFFNKLIPLLDAHPNSPWPELALKYCDFEIARSCFISLSCMHLYESKRENEFYKRGMLHINNTMEYLIKYVKSTERKNKNKNINQNINFNNNNNNNNNRNNNNGNNQNNLNRVKIEHDSQRDGLNDDGDKTGENSESTSDSDTRLTEENGKNNDNGTTNSSNEPINVERIVVNLKNDSKKQKQKQTNFFVILLLIYVHLLFGILESGRSALSRVFLKLFASIADDPTFKTVLKRIDQSQALLCVLSWFDTISAIVSPDCRLPYCNPLLFGNKNDTISTARMCGCPGEIFNCIYDICIIRKQLKDLKVKNGDEELNNQYERIKNKLLNYRDYVVLEYNDKTPESAELSKESKESSMESKESKESEPVSYELNKSDSIELGVSAMTPKHNVDSIDAKNDIIDKDKTQKITSPLASTVVISPSDASNTPNSDTGRSRNSTNNNNNSTTNSFNQIIYKEGITSKSYDYLERLMGAQCWSIATMIKLIEVCKKNEFYENDIQKLIFEFISIYSKLNSNSPIVTQMVWPVFIVSCLCKRDQDRKILKQFMERLYNTVKMGTVMTMIKIAEEVWITGCTSEEILAGNEWLAVGIDYLPM
ncbi:hypothetical protein B5S29_g4394 [[Candida] boidinii]|nr:hypothetical protein B5S29_g4394 [[Candida] boidinii]